MILIICISKQMSSLDIWIYVLCFTYTVKSKFSNFFICVNHINQISLALYCMWIQAPKIQEEILRRWMTLRTTCNPSECDILMGSVFRYYCAVSTFDVEINSI